MILLYAPFELCYNSCEMWKKQKSAASCHIRSMYWLSTGESSILISQGGWGREKRCSITFSPLHSLFMLSLCNPALSCYIVLSWEKVCATKNTWNVDLAAHIVECSVNIKAIDDPSVQYYIYSFCIFDVWSCLLKKNAHGKDTRAL